MCYYSYGRTDELYLKVKGNTKYLFALMDDETHFWIAQQISDKKYTSHINSLLQTMRMNNNQQQQEEEKEFIILKIYKSEIDKAIENLKRREKINQYYIHDYKMIVERSTNTILDDCGWYEILKQAIISTAHTSILERDEL
jgi:hypothetical protein